MCGQGAQGLQTRRVYYYGYMVAVRSQTCQPQRDQNNDAILRIYYRRHQHTILPRSILSRYPRHCLCVHQVSTPSMLSRPTSGSLPQLTATASTSLDSQARLEKPRMSASSINARQSNGFTKTLPASVGTQAAYQSWANPQEAQPSTTTPTPTPTIPSSQA